MKLGLLLLSVTAFAVSELPYPALFANLEELIKKNPRSPRYYSMAGQLHCHAFATGKDTFPVEKQRMMGGVPLLVPKFGDHPHFPQATAKKSETNDHHLIQAKKLFLKALEKNANYSLAQLGLGWVLLQSGEVLKAKQALVSFIDEVYPKESKMPYGNGQYWSFASEAIGHTLPLLNQADQPLRASLKKKRAVLEAIPIRRP